MAALTLLIATATYAETPPTFVLTWGSNGSGLGQFNFPYGIAIAPDGSVLVVDTSNHRIQRFDEDGALLGVWGSGGVGDGQFDFPYGIAVDESSQVYVADWGNSRIQKFRLDGSFLLKWGSFGAAPAQFNRPTDVAVRPGGWVYVADSNNNRVQAFDPSGNIATTWGSYCEVAHGNCGEGNGLFYDPRAIAVDAAGHILVADTGNRRIQKFDPQGAFLAKWGSPAVGDTTLSSPLGLGPGGNGGVYVADSPRVRKFDGNGSLLTMWGTVGLAPGQLYIPTDVAASVTGAVYVLEGGNSRVSKFSTATSGVEPGVGLEMMAWLPGSNPSRGRATLRLVVPRSSPVTARIFDARGHVIREVFSGVLPEGVHKVTWDGLSAGGRFAGSGVYYVLARSGESQVTQRIVFFR